MGKLRRVAKPAQRLGKRAGRWGFKHRRKLWRFGLGWGLPAVVAFAVLFGVRAVVVADTPPSSSELEEYLQNNQLGVYQDIADEYPQIFYRYKDQNIQLTSDNYTHLHPLASGKYITWIAVVNGQAQVFLHDIIAQTTVQLSLVSPNIGVFMKGNTVVWQGWDGDHWQIYMYNGTTVTRITNGDHSSEHPTTNGDLILYAEQLGPNDWQAYSYDIGSGQVAAIRRGDSPSTAYPAFASDGSITTSFTGQ